MPQTEGSELAGHVVIANLEVHSEKVNYTASARCISSERWIAGTTDSFRLSNQSKH